MAANEETPYSKSADVSSTNGDAFDRHAPLLVRGTIIATGIAGLALFTRSLRLFTQFEHARQIPKEFIEKGVQLRGRVANVLDDGSLRVRHQPALPLPRLLQRKSVPDNLSVKLAGVELGEPGRNWLKETLGSNGKKVFLTPVYRAEKRSDVLDCDVFAKLGRLPWKSSLNQELIRRGLARVPSSDNADHFQALTNVPNYSRLVNHLLVSEQVADRRGIGMWRRESWVESLYSLPSQASQIVFNSTPYRLLVLVILGAKNASFAAWKGLVMTYELSVKLGEHGKVGYNWVKIYYLKFADYVKKISQK